MGEVGTEWGELKLRDRYLGHPAVAPISNISVHTIPNDIPIELNADELLILSYGPRFIPIVPVALRRDEWTDAMAQFEHRLAIHQMFAGTPMPTQHVDGTLMVLPYQRSTTGFFKLERGPLKDAVSKLQADVLKSLSQMGSAEEGQFTNLTRAQIRAIGTLKARTQVVVREADKGLGVCVMSREWYNAAARSLLSDGISYEPQPDSLTVKCVVERVHEKFDEVLQDFSFTQPGRPTATTESVFGHKTDVGVASLYLMPKLHKWHAVNAPYATRPIVADVGSVTATASRMVNDVLTAVINHCQPHPWIIKDTLEFLNEIATIPIGEEEEIIIFSWDVVSLYPSIPHDLALRAVGEEVEVWEAQMNSERHHAYEHANIAWFNSPHRNTTPRPSLPPRAERTRELVTRLLQIVLDNGYFTYSDGEEEKLYRQLRGLIMGTSAAPPVANITMFHHMRDLVRQWKDSGKLRFLKAFLDDGFGVFVGSLLEYQEFYKQANALSPDIQFTETHSNTAVQFLDVTVYVGTNAEGTRALCTKPYCKPLNKALYIPPFSGHAPHSLSSFIASETRRLIRNSSREEDAVVAAVAFAQNLVQRGYDLHTIVTQMNKTSFSLRKTYLVRRKPSGANPRGKRAVLALTLPYRPLVTKLRIPHRLHKIQRQLGPSIKLVVGWQSERRLQSYLGLHWPQADGNSDPEEPGG